MEFSTITYSAWMKLGDTTHWQSQHLFSVDEIHQGRFSVGGSSSVPVWCSFSGGAIQAISTFDAETWHHIVCAYDGENIAIYIDGILNASSVAQGNLTWPVNTPWVIGGGWDSWFGGYSTDSIFYVSNSTQDQVAIWDRALSSDEILELYGAGLGVNLIL
jgi:hypothetical protein